jgi:predicted HTH domain antitoxin
MPLLISDEFLEQAGLTEEQARIEFACRLFDAGKLHLWPAARLAGLSRAEFEGELRARGLPVYRITEEHYRQDLEVLRKLGSSG